MNESEFKTWFRANWDSWLESYEPRRGSGVGIPDLQIVVGGRLVPIELKVGTIEDGLVFTKEVRPDQIGWHRRLGTFGVKSWFVVGIGEKKTPDKIYAIRPEHVIHWRNGFDPFELELVTNINSFGWLRR